jgi:putative membrane protein
VVAVDATRLVGALVPIPLAIALHNADAAGIARTITWLAAIGALRAVVDLWRWATTRYRVTESRVEVQGGVLNRRHRSVPRDRIRRVDARARLLHRAYGLAVVTIASGEGSTSSGDQITLDAVSTADAADLRDSLLHRGAPAAPSDASPATAVGHHDAGDDAAEPAKDEELARLRRGWARYAVLSLWVLAAPALAIGTGLQQLDSIGVSVEDVIEDGGVADRVQDVSPAVAIATGAVVAVLVGVAAALLRFVQVWWGYRLEREPGGRLRISRGLLTTRSISLDEARLRGVELTEALPLRAAGGGRLHAVTTGVGGPEDQGERIDALMPAAPVADAHVVAARVLAEDRSPLAPPVLHRHPAAARRRRLVRAGVATALAAAVVAGIAAAGAPAATWLAVPVVGAMAVAWALDAYRGLGHALDGRYLVVRRGAALRRTVALQRAGVVGWTVRSTVFQRRAGLATVVATTAAGGGAYELVDVDAEDGLRIAAEAVPGLLSPFLTGGRVTGVPVSP